MAAGQQTLRLHMRITPVQVVFCESEKDIYRDLIRGVRAPEKPRKMRQGPKQKRSERNSPELQVFFWDNFTFQSVIKSDEGRSGPPELVPNKQKGKSHKDITITHAGAETEDPTTVVTDTITTSEIGGRMFSSRHESRFYLTWVSDSLINSCIVKIKPAADRAGQTVIARAAAAGLSGAGALKQNPSRTIKLQ
ncbi:hypothetical protein EVAR_64739_1 [Eumeta japonica]|uniref:Uncharacterized protein n=1 Tax=Eumeta variegata TaxID=151549 RepID=A0A4C1Z6C0_EUMVA|nr:hypothetical protein EVAR_64739_1 [Eumeta japonica]